MAKVGLYALSKLTTLESNKSHYTLETPAEDSTSTPLEHLQLAIAKLLECAPSTLYAWLARRNLRPSRGAVRV